MKKKKIVFFFLSILVFFGLFIFHGKRLIWSSLVLNEILHFEKPGLLWQVSSSPKIREVVFSGPQGMVKADLYLPQPVIKRAGIILNHGVIDTGKDDPRLRRFAEILCRAGFVVLVPDFQGMRSFRISPHDIDEIQAAFEHFLQMENYLLKNSCGLFGFSYGAGPTIIAACRPKIRDKVRFVVSFGGYYDLKNVLSFIGTGHFEFAGKKFFRPPQEYGKWVFLANNLELVRSEKDRSILREIAKIKLKDEKAPLGQFLRELGNEGQDILALLSHTDPRETEAIIKRLPLSIQHELEVLAVKTALPNLRADIILAHGEDDDLIPFTETLRIAQSIPDPKRAYWKIIRTFTHVDHERYPLNFKNLFAFYLPEAGKMFALVNQLMKYRE
ncbi:MAG: alpha/beta hydrolase family protein [Thermodesulfobacteriota bacterium]